MVTQAKGTLTMKIQNPTTGHQRFGLLFRASLKATAFVAVMVLCCTMAQAQTSKIRASHEDMENPKSTTDEYGITVPIPADFAARRFPAEEGFPTGPAVGDAMPDFELPNQDGEVVSFQKVRGGKKAAVVFYRSAVW